MDRAQGLSTQTIVVAVLCLVILVVLLFIFSGRLGDFNDGAQRCELAGGECRSPSCLEGELEIKGVCANVQTGQSTGEICCATFG